MRSSHHHRRRRRIRHMTAAGFVESTTSCSTQRAPFPMQSKMPARRRRACVRREQSSFALLECQKCVLDRQLLLFGFVV